jgi:tetratricopeptide (TPR) repeat protein
VTTDSALAGLQTATARFGRGSVEWASAQCDLGNALLGTGQHDRAADCFRQAASVKPRDDESRKDRLTYLTNLGVALGWAGRHREAEKELRRALKERLGFYGREHPGYAYGLEPLADLLRRRGKLRDARPVVEEAVANLWRNGHDHLVSALVLRAAIIAAGGTGEPFFAGLHQLPDEVVAEVGHLVAQWAGPEEPVSEPLLVATIAALDDRLGPDHQATLDALSVLANLGGDARTEAIERVFASYERQGRHEDALTAELALAAASSSPEAAFRTYESAQARADRIGRPELRSQVLRNWGLALKDAGHAGPAEQRLTEAVHQGRLSSGNETLGRAAVALGILLQHRQRLDEARNALEEGLAALDPAHLDAIVGRSHLSAAQDGLTCGCDSGYLSDSLATAFREFVVARLPADLLDRIEVSIADGEFQVEVALRREPAEGEIDRLNEVFAAADADFRRQLR